LALPFARRAESTFLPFFVAILARKPCLSSLQKVDMSFSFCMVFILFLLMSRKIKNNFRINHFEDPNLQ